MQPKRLIAGAAAYLAVTFPLAYTWHLVLFKPTYERLGYFSRDEPIVVYGFLAILLQGVIPSFIYPLLCRGLPIVAGATRLALVMGLYHWSMHVLAEAAKHPIEPLTTWFGLETAYLAIQFGLAGLLMAIIHRNSGTIVLSNESPQ